MRTFRDFMESALYDPERGYYSTRTPTADFYTAPELHRAFGAMLADNLAALLRRARAARPDAELSLVEAGCGDGTLAAQVAARLRSAHADVFAGLRWILVERSRRDLTTATQRLSDCGLPVQAVTDIARAPRFAGVLYSNELLDALPAHLLRKQSGQVREVYVGEDGRETLGPLSRSELTAAAAAVAGELPEGACHAVSLEVRRWIAEAAGRLEAGFVLSLDYGKRFSDLTPNPPRAYLRHRIEPDLLAAPGRQDLTAPVDFEAVITAGAAAGLELESYASLSRFLIEAGIERWLAAVEGSGLSSYKERTQLKTLFHPEGMGEAFKVLIQRKGVPS